MNVLLLSHDLYLNVGGGQTVYKRLIETNPGITFYYLGLKETPTSHRPVNAKMVPFKEEYPAAGLSGEFSELGLHQASYFDFIESSNIAASVAHLQIDVVDMPDYLHIGYLLSAAMLHHGQKNCRLAIAMHGNLSETQEVNWGNHTGMDVSYAHREQWQYRIADLRYGLSKDYLDQWEKIGQLRGHYLNPLRFVAAPRLGHWNRMHEGVSLNFIGRTERFKGPDLFLELLTLLPQGSYKEARIIGPAVNEPEGVGSTNLLKSMATARTLAVEFHACMSKVEMAKIYGERGITVLPSRMDTFNLTALESLYAGCPVAVSKKAGVCRFLRETYPGLPFISLDVDQLYTGADDLLKVMRDYDKYRDRLCEYVEEAKPAVDGLSLEEVYTTSQGGEIYLRDKAVRLYDELYRFHRKNRTSSYQKIYNLGMRVCDAVRTYEENNKAPNVEMENDLWWIYRKCAYLAEKNTREIDAKTDFCATVASRSRIDRARRWAEMARLERVRSNDLVAATYDIRVMRALGEDRLGLLPLTVSVLKEHGFSLEAEALFALYGPEEKRLERGRQLLEAARKNHLAVPERPFEFIEDSRTEAHPRLGIVVSLYNAANKLETFLRRLAQLPWVKSGFAELILIDSHSPTDEHVVFKRVNVSLGIKTVYARTEHRETIQKAWNRGILLSRAPYLTFLGVDEMVRPDCFELLAAELDQDLSLDWVQGNSLITEVDMAGNLNHDGMLYQRIPYEQDFVYLETCYLSWVGGMYRKNMHDRFGYYDESFGAAGDTEFKNRILPYIRSKTLPLTLGIFLNYPEERTTQSPRAEIEDLRAWYLHRSEAGVEYALAPRDPSDALQLLVKAIGYRKSYRAHISTDLDYAAAIVSFAIKKLPGRALYECAQAIKNTLDAYRALDWVANLSPRALVRARKHAEQAAQQSATEVRNALKLPHSPSWQIFNDNRFDQHSWVWSSKPLLGRFFVDGRHPWCRSLIKHGESVMLETKENIDEASTSLGREVEFLAAAIKKESAAALARTENDLARDLGTVAQYIIDVSNEKKPSYPDAASAGSLLCRLLSESQPSSLFSNAAFFTAKVATLCQNLSKLASDHCVQLSDAFDGLVSVATQFRTMEIAARLMAYKQPDEAVKKHRAELSGAVLEIIERAAESAKAGGNQLYYDRSTALAVAIREEILSEAGRV